MKASGLFEYLNHVDTLCHSKCVAKNAEQLLDLEVLMETLQVRSAFKVRETFKKLNSSTASENEKTNSLFGIDTVSLALTHIAYSTFLSFYTKVHDKSIKDPKV